MKLGQRDIDTSVLHLLRLSKNVDVGVDMTSSFLAIAVPTGMVYRRNDGVYVIPIGCLRP